MTHAQDITLDRARAEARAALLDAIGTLTENKVSLADARALAKETNAAKAARVRETLRTCLLHTTNPLGVAAWLITDVCQGLAEVVADSKTLANKKQDVCRSVCKAFESITHTAVKAVCVDKKAHIYALELADGKEETPATIAAALIKKWDKAGINPQDVADAILDAMAVDIAKAEAMEAAKQAIQVFA